MKCDHAWSRASSPFEPPGAVAPETQAGAASDLDQARAAQFKRPMERLIRNWSNIGSSVYLLEHRAKVFSAILLRMQTSSRRPVMSTNNELEPTLERTLPIWWLLAWRGTICGALMGGLLGVTIGIVWVALHWSS